MRALRLLETDRDNRGRYEKLCQRGLSIIFNSNTARTCHASPFTYLQIINTDDASAFASDRLGATADEAKKWMPVSVAQQEVD